MDNKTQFTWTIPNYNEFISKDIRSLKSPVFNMKNSPNKNWFLLLEKDLQNTNIVRFYAYCNGTYEESFFNFTMNLTIKDSLNQLVLTMMKKSIGKFEPIWHWIGIIDHSFAFLKHAGNNNLVLVFELDVTSDNKSGNAMIEVTEIEDTQIEDIKTEDIKLEEKKVFSFMNDKMFSDVTLHVGRKKFFAHKVILATESKVFHEMFAADESLEKVKITNASYDVLMEMLRYLYTGQVQNLDELEMEIMRAAHFYQIEDLIGICENSMIVHLNDNNVVDFLILADDCQAQTLKNECLKRIQRNFENFRYSSRLEPLSKGHAHLLLDIIKGMPVQTKLE